MIYVLDSNAVIAAFRQEPRVLDRLSHVSASDIALPIIVFAELLYGAQRSQRKTENLEKVRELGNRFSVTPLSFEVVERYGLVRANLEARGLPKSDFDLLIACTALELDATLVTNDGALKDGVIDGLRVEDWVEG